MSRKKSKHRKAVREVAAAPVVEAAEIELAPDEPSTEVVAGAEPVLETKSKRRGKKTDGKETSDALDSNDAINELSVDSVGEPSVDSVETSDELSAEAPLADAPSEELSVESVDELSAHAPNEEIPDAQMASEELRAEGDGAGDDAPPGDDIVGEQITDEAGVEAALLPGGLSAVQLRHLIEALVFAADKPVTLQRLRQLTRVSDVTRIEAALAELQDDYKDRGIALQQVSGGYQFRTNTTFSSWVQQLIAGRPVRLSRAQLETLAIVAYRQPITRPEIDEIRGVDSSATLRLLLERSLIRVLGKREEVGRPTLYGTTKEFLDFFSLSDLRELPTLREYSELTAESRQVMSDRLGVPLDANGDLIEPEVAEIDTELETPQDNASIVDSILAEHAAAEAEAEARFDASAVAEAALSGGGSFGEALTPDDDSMALSGEVSAFGGSTEARSYVDAIRASLATDELDGLGEIDDVEISAEADEQSNEVEIAHMGHESAMHAGHAQSNEAEVAHVGHGSESYGDEAAVHEPSMAHVDAVVHADQQSNEAEMAHVGHEDGYEAAGHEQSNEAEMAHVDHASESNNDETVVHVGHEQSNEAEMAHVGHDSDTRYTNDETDPADLGCADHTGESHRDDAGIAETNALPESPDSDSDDSEGN